tara:strand:+ start:1014 stop:1979 length:966 start_codon:yes stop_codon:yes gene_type:complete
MGGSNAPSSTVSGALEAARELGIESVLVGDKKTLQAELASQGAGQSLEIVHASEVIAMGEHPAEALRKKKHSSVKIAAQLVRDGEAGAMVSMGNSGATMAAGVLITGRVEGVLRPALAVMLPGVNGDTLLLDVGANSDCSPDNLRQFAVMGSAYLKTVLGIDAPSVGQLNMGEEEGKGNQLAIDSEKLLKESPINYHGNVEGVDLFRSIVDIAVCDGFTGNVALKVAEGVGDFALGTLGTEIKTSLLSRLGALALRPSLKKIAKSFDYTERGATPLLGLRGLILIGHGRSNAKAVTNAIIQAKKAVDSQLAIRVASELVSN